MDYCFLRQTHPIMSCLADQTRYDPEWIKYCFTDETLLEAILFNLEIGNIAWSNVSFITKKEWIKNTKENPIWYVFTEDLTDPQFIMEAENLLINLASNYLKRQIQLIPIFAKGIKTFGNVFSNVNTYQLLSCQHASLYSFFISVF